MKSTHEQPLNKIDVRHREWISVEEELPNGNCLAFYKNSHGKERIVKAFYAKHYEIEQNIDSEYYEYNDTDDRCYLPEGWHECIDNWEEYSSVAIHEGIVTHWIPLPEYPDQNT